MTSLRIRVYSAASAARLVYRCWRVSREMGVPFEDVFEMQMATLEEVMWDEHYRKEELRARGSVLGEGEKNE